jgi:hypothetical protein
MGIAGYVSVCVQLYYVDFHSFTTCFGLHGHLQVCRIFIFVFLNRADKQQRKSKQTNTHTHTHTQGNNTNNEGKQHRNKTQMESRVPPCGKKKGSEQKEKKQRSRIL